MRISAIFKIVGQTLPLDYRSGFISLLKTSYKLASPDIFYSSIYETNSLKPFTFSVYFGNKSKVQDNKIFINTDTIIL
ncbi:MAG: hypothetical protein M1135_01650, partial [Candidatus Omnitrophica bacterium]|nr:hypothetical protein [Candidatus Omnitrophota bacterium]